VEKLQFQTRDENFESFVQNIDNVLRKNVPETSSSLVVHFNNYLFILIYEKHLIH
jgi:hypothetical protein